MIALSSPGLNSTRQSLRFVSRAAFVLCLVVVVLGAYVRLSAAGLGCPDWPGCYGHFTPAGAADHAADASARFGGQVVEVGKAWREMIHRYAAGTLGVFIVAIAALTIQYRRERWVAPWYGLGLVGLVVVQAMLGMLTVTWQLKPLIVTSHLLLGLTTLSLLWWLVLSLERASPTGSAAMRATTAGSPVRWWALLALAALAAQIALGGWTSSNYAATACPDFPRCQDAWWPASDFGDAFVLWRGLDINYEGGILNQAARVAIQLAHRLGALAVTVLLLSASYSILRSAANAPQRRAALAVAGMMLLQLVIGISMVVEGFPLWLATAHNAGAALLLLSVVALNHTVFVGAPRS